mgnify:CR=1 FL=1
MKKRPACAGLWSTPMIHVNGDLTTCCLDEHLVNKIGNLAENSLDEIWNSEQMDQWRLAQIEGRFEDSGPLCTRCNWQSAGTITDEFAEKWLLERKKTSAPLSKRKRVLYVLSKIKEKLKK